MVTGENPAPLAESGSIRPSFGFTVRVTPWIKEKTLIFAPADKIVKVPEMAESISEGTLKQWQKSRETTH